MRIVFMGSPDFAVPSLGALADAGHEIVAVYSQPPRAAGRGKDERKTAVHIRAEELGLELRTPRTLRDARGAILKNTEAPRMVSAGASSVP